MPREAALDRLRRIGPSFRSKDAVMAGVSWRDLYALRDDGEILELSRGLYQLADTIGGELDFVAVSGRAPHGMVCLNSALAHWELSDEIPRRVHLAVPEGSHRPSIDYPPTHVHVFAARTFLLGRLKVDGDRGEAFWISDRERTLADVFRLRHLVGEDLAHGALRHYLQKRPNTGQLAEVARPLRAWGAISAALRVLQS
ncbi:type IV toxin-antitoxin system AbiEi family antitoxin domain-containing protein [Tenggerimyces flavus]|uniref:Type IV toxin-antitoxin system AbiEi family antitoxin domain-containing protein n=1 Tax=Tenggerimyces flavus TaxID=1708749 RepID=A0ABV7Y5C3_9ACTN|nr:type IV toxin-antitoxin system AbiEi family antitoxin domain-containing protein [Tenggerimyces flavus]MBM7791234.1 putative transcriptional regulator of viral defense system [Tenggerimyces flavus]